MFYVPVPLSRAFLLFSAGVKKVRRLRRTLRLRAILPGHRHTAFRRLDAGQDTYVLERWLSAEVSAAYRRQPASPSSEARKNLNAAALCNGRYAMSKEEPNKQKNHRAYKNTMLIHCCHRFFLIRFPGRQNKTINTLVLPFPPPMWDGALLSFHIHG